jgi:hypothetical protein
LEESGCVSRSLQHSKAAAGHPFQRSCRRLPARVWMIAKGAEDTEGSKQIVRQRNFVPIRQHFILRGGRTLERA